LGLDRRDMPSVSPADIALPAPESEAAVGHPFALVQQKGALMSLGGVNSPGEAPAVGVAFQLFAGQSLR
jgi:hypothetical protein